jgi:hypothetical protein
MRKNLDGMKDDADAAGDALAVHAAYAYPGPAAAVNSFFSFRYAYLEIAAQGGKVYVKSRETRFENGRLIAEECEGALDHDAAQRMLLDAQRQFIEQMTLLMKPFLAFLPFHR